MSKEKDIKLKQFNSDDIVAKIDSAIKQVAEGKVIGHSEVKKKIDEWSSKRG